MTFVPHGNQSVMAARLDALDSPDYFPTPPWATRALVVNVLPDIGVTELGTVWEPACGEGHMARVLAEYTRPVIATDAIDYGFGTPHIDFYKEPPPECRDAAWIITNPPFAGALAFTKLAIERAKVGVAMLVRTQWIESVRRYEQLFCEMPPTLFAPFVERVPLTKGRWNPNASTATSYAWFVWLVKEVPRRAPTEVFWIPPGRRESLSHPDDRRRFASWSLP